MTAKLLFASCALVAGSLGAQTIPHQKISSEAGGLGDLADAFDHFGSAVDVVGDLDGDGRVELAVGGWGGDFVQILFLASDLSIAKYQRIGAGDGGFTGTIDNYFGHAVEALGDLDGDGVGDLAVGERLHGNNQGAIWILFLNPDGTVKSHQLIAEGEGGFVGTLTQNYRLGSSLAVVGDLDGDGVVDLASGAEGAGSGFFEGGVQVLFLRADGTVKAQQFIGEGSGGFTGALASEDYFGSSLASADVNRDGTLDLAVGAEYDSLGGPSPRGAVHVLLLNPDGTVQSQQKLGSPALGWHNYGSAVAFLEDLAGDGTIELAVGADFDNDGPASSGSVYIHSLSLTGSIVATQKISALAGGFGGSLAAVDRFGSALANLGDIDGDGYFELMVGAEGDNDGAFDHGALWRLDLASDGTVVEEVKISAAADGDVPNTLELGDRFGQAVAPLGDVNGDGVLDLMVGADDDDTADTQTGAVWVLQLAADGTVGASNKITAGEGGFTGPLAKYDHFGNAVAPLGDLDGNGVLDVAVGAEGDDQSGPHDGAVWILFLDTDGTVLAQTKITEGAGGLGSVLEGHAFGTAVAPLGDLDGDGVPDVAVGEPGSSSGVGTPGTVWILFLNADGTVKHEVEISEGLGGFGGALGPHDEFGAALGVLGDMDGDGVVDLAVGAPNGNDGNGLHNGGVWLLMLRPDGTVKDQREISATTGNFVGEYEEEYGFGGAVAATYLDDDDAIDLIVGAPESSWVNNREGAVWLLYLNADGTVRSHERVSALDSFAGVLDPFDGFGASVTPLGDFNGDGSRDWAVGMPGDDDGGFDHGAVWLIYGDGAGPEWGYQTYGCDALAQDSLVVLAGEPRVGADFTLGMTNPLGTQAPGSLTLLFLATAPDPGFPCGTPLVGFGLPGGGAAGELLLSVQAPNPLRPPVSGAPWSGTEPAAVELSVPPLATFAGLTLYTQGVLLDTSPGATLPIALTAGIAVTIAE